MGKVLIKTITNCTYRGKPCELERLKLKNINLTKKTPPNHSFLPCFILKCPKYCINLNKFLFICKPFTTWQSN